MPITVSILDELRLGDPREHRGAVVCPLFARRAPAASYVTLDEALPLGFTITEVDEAGTVPELLVTNPLDTNVLLYDGEELVGAKQNRILNLTVLVAAGASVTIPVSCVEHGRWRRIGNEFAAAPQAAYPDLRRRKAAGLTRDPRARGLVQHDVWDAVAEKHARHGTHSPTGAARDLFVQREHDLAALREAFPLEPEQVGAVLALGSQALTLDCVSRPEAFARLYPKLLDGYLLDALEGLDQEPAGRARLEMFLDAVAGAPRRTSPSEGLGEDVRLSAEGVVGSGLALDGELLQLSAYSR